MQSKLLKAKPLLLAITGMALMAFSSQGIAQGELSSAFTNVKNSGYQIDSCYAELGGYTNFESLQSSGMNMCGSKAISLYDQILNSKPSPNFAKDYLFMRVVMPAVGDMPKNYKVFNYAAINPKTKDVHVLPYSIYAPANDLPKFSFNKDSNRLCTVGGKWSLENEGMRTSLGGYGEDACLTFNPRSDIKWIADY